MKKPQILTIEEYNRLLILKALEVPKKTVKKMWKNIKGRINKPTKTKL